MQRRGIDLPEPDADAEVAEIPEIDPDQRILDRCILLACSGTVLPLGAECTVIFTSDRVNLLCTSTGQELSCDYADVRELELGGPGAVQRGGGYVGGGFGIGGALEGMLVAQALNALTTRTTIQTLVRLATHSNEFIWEYCQASPQQLRIFLSPAFVRIAAARQQLGSQQTAARTSDPISQLQRLADLRAAGVLTEQEFEAAKARIIRDMT